MALPPLITPEDFETWASRPVSNRARAEAIIAAASTLVRTHSGRMWVDAAGEPEEDVTELQIESAKTVVLQVTDRVYFNPSGNTQNATGPFSASVAAWYSAGMYLTDDDKAQLPTTTSARPALWTQATTRCDNDVPDIYLEVEDSTEPIVHVPHGYPW